MSCQLSTINYQIMIKHIFKIIWAQRKSNGWILGELVIVMCALWFEYVAFQAFHALVERPGLCARLTLRLECDTGFVEAYGTYPPRAGGRGSMCYVLVHALFKRKFVGYAPSLGR